MDKMNFHIRLADGWQTFHRKSSVWVSASVAVASPALAALRGAWQQMPDDLKAVVPHSMQQAISYTILAGTFLILRYTVVERKDKGDAAN
jgi:hypothetical protein